jgi:hypothetical protein
MFKRHLRYILRNKYFYSINFFIFFYIIIIYPSFVTGNTYYVSPDGNDSNLGTRTKPWNTIQKAAETLTPGDTVYVRKGTYRERVIPQNSGSIGSYIVYMAHPGDEVTIEGNNITLPSEWGGLLEISSLSYIVMSGFRIINAGPNDNSVGILVDNSNHIIVRNNYTYNTVSSGIGVWNSYNIVIDGNEVEMACNDGEQECITVAVTNNFEVRNNHVHHGGPGSIGGEGIDIKEGSFNGKVYKNVVHDINRLGIYVDSWDKNTFNIEVFGNLVHDCAEDGFVLASEAGGLLDNIKVYNNIAYQNAVGMTVAGWGEDVPERPMSNIKIINNTFYNNGDPQWGGGISVENPDIENIVIRNNIVSQNLMFQIQIENPVQNLQIDHNLIDGYRDYPDEVYGNDFVEGNPMFVDIVNVDFNLQESSPAINKGSLEDAPDDDFNGNIRPQSGAIDIGAFEYTGSTGVKDYKNDPGISFMLYQNFPNPFNPETTIRFYVGQPCQIVLTVYNILGKVVVQLADEYFQVGQHMMSFNVLTLSSGVYFCRMETGDFCAVRKMVVLE